QTRSTTTATPSNTFSVKLPKQGLGIAAVEPFMVGTYEIGKQLTVVGQEGWRPTNATFTSRWMVQRDNAPYTAIPGATSASYTPTAAQAGLWIYAEVTASRSGYKPAVMST